MWPLLRSFLFRSDAETVHHKTMSLASAALSLPPVRWLASTALSNTDARLRLPLLGFELTSPVGLAAGFDKNAEWFNALGALGFGFVEVGTLTGQAQSGNPKPRLFRLPADRAVINRMGFNNGGSEDAARRLATAHIRPVLGINIGKSKVVANEDALSDYLVSLERLVPYARYVAVNVSSPNTAGLRDLQHADALRSLLEGLLQRNQELAAERGADAPPMLVKIAPDLSDEQLDEIVELAESLGLDGIIATNTTIARAPLKTDAAEIEAIGAGGLSGAPLTSRSREVVARLYARCGGRLTIMGVGGIEDGDDAYEMMRAGASAVQLYTGFIYGGPNIIRSINERLLERLEADGLRHISEAVGAAHRESGAPA